MPESPPVFGPGTSDAIDGAKDEALDIAAEATGLTDVKAAKDLYGTAKKAEKFVDVVEEMRDRDPQDLAEAIRDFHPAKDLANLLDSIPIINTIGGPVLVDVLEDIQDAIDRAQEWASNFEPPWNDIDPETPPTPPPAPPPSPNSPWGPPKDDQRDPITNPPKDPLVLDLDGDGVELIAVADSDAYFDLDGNSFAEKTGWVGPDDGFLVIDANSNGQIDDISEMFGDGDTDGFDALAAYDLNTDGVINASDAVFANLRVWVDADGDGETDSGELQTLATHGISSFSLTTTASNTLDEGNLVARLGSFTGSGGTRTAATVWFGTNQLLSEYILPPSFTFDATALLLPDLQGYGNVANLRVAMTLDSDLLDAAVDLVVDASDLSYDDFRSRLTDLIIQWADVGTITPGSRGANVDAERLAVLEKFYGNAFPGNPNASTGALLEKLFTQMIDHVGLRFIAQVPYSDVLLHVNPTQDALENVFWGFAQPDYDGEVSSLAFDLEDLIWRITFEQQVDYPEDGMTYLAKVMPWVTVLKDELYNGDAEAFGDALRFYLYEQGHDNALTVAAYELTLGRNIVDAEEAGALAGTSAADFMVLDVNGLIATGGAGNDSYGVEQGVHVEINEVAPGPFTPSADDAILFEGRLLADTLISYVGGQLLFTFAGDPDSAVLVNVPLGVGQIERYVFQDQTLAHEDIIHRLVLPGGENDDGIGGTALDDELDGGAGNDILAGGLGDDIYLFGAGSGRDVVVEYDGQGTDAVLLGGELIADDLSFTRANDDLLISIDGEPDLLTIRGYFADDTIEELRFYDSSTLSAAAINLLVPGGSGSTLSGTSGADTINSGAGNDRLTGGNGSDTYVYQLGDGYDVIADASYIYTDSPSSVDTLVLDGIALADVKFSRVAVAYGHHLVIDILGPTPGRIVLEKAILNADVYNGRIETFVFDDVTLTSREVEALLLIQSASDRDDYLLGTQADDVIEGGLGNDEIYGWGGRDTVVWTAGDGRDVIDAVNHGTLILHEVDPQDVTVLNGVGGLELSIGGSRSQAILFKLAFFDRILFDDGAEWDRAEIYVRLQGSVSQVVTEAGTAGEDELTGTAGSDVLEGGLDDDLLHGGGGADNYRFSAGDGNDVIVEWGSDLTDSITLTDLAPEDIWAERDGHSLVLHVIATSETITVEDHFLSTDYGIERIYFDGGAVWDMNAIAWNAPIRGTASADYLSGTVSGTVYDSYDEVFLAGLGDDIIVGGLGSDGYIWRLGDGDDTISDGAQANDLHAVDLLAFTDLEAEDFTVSWNADGGLVMRVISSGETITLSAQQSGIDGGPGYGVEVIRFADGEKWSQQDIEGLAIFLGDGSDERFDASSRDDIIVGGGGDDDLHGGAGSDEYRYEAGDGNDEVVEADVAGVDVLALLDLTALDVLVGLGLAGELKLYVRATGETITLVDQQAAEDGVEGLGIEVVHFADNAEWTQNDLLANALILGGGDADELSGTSGADVLAGVAGDDELSGGTGSDVYRYWQGDGDDTLSDFDGDPGDTDVLDLVDIDLADVTIGVVDADVIVTVDGGGSIRLSGQIGAELGWGNTETDGVELIQFADSQSLTREDLLLAALGQLYGSVGLGTASTDTLSVSSGTGYLNGRGGDDLLTGGALADWIRGGAGADEIDGGGDSDSLQGEDGDDEVLGGAGDDFLGGDAGEDLLTGGLGADYLDGGEGSDLFAYDDGDGDDTVTDFGYDAATDQLVFGAGLTDADVTYSRSGYDLVLTVVGSLTTSTITVMTQFDGDAAWGIEEVVFANSVVWTRATIEADLLAASQTSGNDLILGYVGDDILEGGLGDDELDGGMGDDSYLFDAGDGDDTITDYSGVADELVFGSGLALVDMTIERVGDEYESVRLTFGTGESVFLVGQLFEVGFGSEQGVEAITFSGPTTLTKEDLVLAILAQESTSGADRIKGFGRNDTLTGGGGADTFVYGAAAFGDDTITDFDVADDIVEFSAGIFASFYDVTSAATQVGSDVLIMTGYGSLLLEDTVLANLTSANFDFV